MYRYTCIYLYFRKWKTDRQQKGQKAKQRSTKHTHKNKDRVTGTPLKTGMKLDAPEG
jgi:hypothetical protein